MSVLFVASLVIRGVATLWAIALVVRLRDWRMTLFALLLALMTLRLVLELANSRSPAAWDELLGFLVSVVALFAVGLVGRMIFARERAERGRAAALDAERTSRELLTKVLERVTDGFVALDKDWRYTFVNHQAGEMLGGRHDLVGKHIWTEFPSGVGQKFQLAYERAMAEQHPIELEEYYPPFERWFENRIYPSPQGLTIFFHDTTERNRTQEALRDSETRNRQIIATAREGIILHDRDLRYRVWNPFMEELSGMRAQDVLGRHPADLFPWAVERGFVALLERALAGEQMTPPDFEAPGPTGPVFTSARYVPFRDEGGGIVGVLVVVHDVTVRHRAQEALRESYENLRALSARVEAVREEEGKRIAREVHDEVGQALTALKLDLSALERRLGACPDDLRDTLVGRVHEMAGIVGGTMDVVQRISTELRPALLDDLGLAAAIDWQLQAFAQRTGIASRIVGQIDEARLVGPGRTAAFRIFQEALTNVARHAAASAVEVTLREGDDHAVLEVKDDGRGIPEAALQDGRALGLAGMRERAHLVGGVAEVQRQGGAGTIVRARIPLG